MRLFGLPAVRRALSSVGASRTRRCVSAAAVCGLILAAALPANAATVTSTGYAINPITGNPVGFTENRPALGGQAIKYFITLENVGGTYGVGGSCEGTGTGTCHDEGNGNGVLEMHLRFAFAQALDDGNKTLQIRFEDLDLWPKQDPWWHFEAVQVEGYTDFITSAFNPLLSWNWQSDVITLTLLLAGLPGDDEFFFKLRFYADPLFSGRNTPEYLIAQLTGTLATPLPAAVWLFISALAGLGGLSRLRRWRAERQAVA